MHQFWLPGHLAVENVHVLITPKIEAVALNTLLLCSSLLQPGAYFASSVRMLRVVYTSTNSNACVHTILIQLHVFVCLFVSTPTNSIICIHTLFSFMFLFVCLFVCVYTHEF